MTFKSLAKFILGFFIFSLIFFSFNFIKAQASWVKMNDSSGHDNVYISNDDLVGTNNTSLAVDSAGNPYIVWEHILYDSGYAQLEGNIYFSKWTPGIGWTKMDGTLGYEDISGTSYFFTNPIIKLDSGNNPHVTWQITGGGDIYFTKWTPGTGWTKIDNTLGNDAFSLTGTEIYAINFELASNNVPYVSWAENDGTSRDVFITKGIAGSGWKKMNGTSGHENVSNSSDYMTDNRWPVLKVGSDNNPYLMWTQMLAPPNDWSNGDIMFTKWTPGTGWTDMNGVLGLDDVSGSTIQNNGSGNCDFQFDSNNRPYLIWSEDINGPPTYNWEMMFSKWTPGTGWTKMNGTLGKDNLSNNSGDSFPGKIKLSSSNVPYVAWQDMTTGYGDIYFSKWTAGTGWTGMDGVTLGYDNVSESVVGSAAQIFLDGSDNPEIAWPAGGDIVFKKWTAGTGWTKMDGTVGYDNVSNTGAAGLGSNSMQLGTSSYPYFVWPGYSIGGDIYFTKWGMFGLAPLDGQVDITAAVDPSLSLNLSSTTCNLGVFDSTKANTCQYNTTVTTNASSGYTAYIRDDGNLRNATNDINDVAGGTTTVGSEEYGVATSDTDALDITAKESSADCTTHNGGVTDVNALALTTSDQSYASEAAPIASNVVTLCHSASIAGSTPAGAYAQTVTITVVGNF